MYFDVRLCSSCLQVKSREVGRFGSGRVDFSKLLCRRAVFFRAAEPDEVRELDASAEEVVASIDTEDRAKPVLKIILRTVRSCSCIAENRHTRRAGSRFTRSISNHVRQNTREIHMQ